MRPNKYRTSCFFYTEVPDMSALIPTCDYYHQLGVCRCENCPLFISKKDVDTLIRNLVNNRQMG